MHGGLARAPIQGWLGAREQPAQLTQEHTHRHGPPSWELVETRRQLVEARRAPGQQPDPATAVAQRRTELLQLRRGAEVVADIAPAVQKRDKLLPRALPGLGEAGDTGIGEHAVGPCRDSSRDPRPEERRRQGPALDLVGARVNVDAELGRVPSAEGIDEAPREVTVVKRSCHDNVR